MSDSFPIILQPGQAHTFQVAFKPTGEGSFTGNLRFTTNAPGSPHNVSLSGIGTAAPQPSDMSWLATQGGDLITVNDGKKFRLKSVNWYGMESILMPGPLWARAWKTIQVGSVTHLGCIDEMKALGFNSIRIPICEDVTWPGRTITAGNYVNVQLNPSLFIAGGDPFATPQPIRPAIECLDLFVEHAASLGMRVVLDMHCLAPNTDNTQGTGGLWYTTANPGDQGGTAGTIGEPRSEAQWIAAWTFLANRYKNQPAVCGFDLVNEPHNGTWDDDPLTGMPAAYERCAAAIHAINPNVLIICEGVYGVHQFPGGQYWGTIWSGDLVGVRTRPVVTTVPNRVVYSPHDYAQDGAMGGGQQGPSWLYEPDFPANMPEVWGFMWGYLAEEGIAPLWIGEFGATFGAGKTVNNQWVAALHEYTNAHNISWAYWCYNNGPESLPGILSSTDWKTVNQNIMTALQPMIAANPSDGPAADPGWLTADGALLRDGNGQQVILRSVGWYGLEQNNHLRGTSLRTLRTRQVLTNDEVFAGTTQTRLEEGILAELYRIGFNSIRIPISQHTARDGRSVGSYAVDPMVNPDFIRGYLGDGLTWGPNEDSWKLQWDKATWGAYAQSPPWYSANGGDLQPIVHSLAMLDRLIDECERLGMRVILDMHCLANNDNNELGTGGKWYTTANRTDPGQDTGAKGELRNEEQMMQAWEFFANRYKNRPIVSCFDLLNEPFNCTWDAGNTHLETNVRAFYERCAARIFDINPNVFLWCEGIHGKTYVNGVLEEYYAMPFPGVQNNAHIGIQFAANLTGVAAARVVGRKSNGDLVPNKIGYSPHYYGPSENAMNLYNGTIGSTDPKVAMGIWIKQLWGYIAEQDIAPVWIGEMSAKFFDDRSIPGMNATWAQRDRDWMDVLSAYCREHSINFAYWAVNADVNRQNGIMEGSDVTGYTGHDAERMLAIAPMFEETT